MNEKPLEAGNSLAQNIQDNRGNGRILYEYRDFDGQLFSCIAGNKEECIRRKDEWLRAK